MGVKIPDIKELERRNVFSVLAYLYKVGRCKKTDFYNNVSRTNTMASKLDYLELNGLIKLDYRRFENNTTYVELTPVGKSVAKKLLDVQDILSGEMIIDSDPDDKHDVFSEKQDITSSESISYPVSTSVQSPTLIKILVVVQNNPGITADELTKRFGKENLCKTIQDAEKEAYIFESDMGRSDVKSGYHITAKGIDLVGCRVFVKKGEDVMPMDCGAPSSEENMAKR